MCYFGTNNPFLIYALCVILPISLWGTPHYSQPAAEERRLYGEIGHIKHWKPCQWALIRYFEINNRLLIYALCVILPSGQWGTPFTPNRPLRNRQLFAVMRRIKHWKQCLGAPMCYFGTISPLLIYALCMILPTATEEWLYLTAIWGTWNTLNLENHPGGLDG